MKSLNPALLSKIIHQANGHKLNKFRRDKKKKRITLLVMAKRKKIPQVAGNAAL